MRHWKVKIISVNVLKERTWCSSRPAWGGLRHRSRADRRENRQRTRHSDCRSRDQAVSDEGQRRHKHAEEGIRDLRRHVDTLLIIPNQRLLGIVDKATPLLEAFKVADDVLRQAIQGIADVITTTGHVNVDFADVRTIMSHTGRAVMGMGISRGTNRAIEAAQKAICHPCSRRAAWKAHAGYS